MSLDPFRRDKPKPNNRKHVLDETGTRCRNCGTLTLQLAFSEPCDPEVCEAYKKSKRDTAVGRAIGYR